MPFLPAWVGGYYITFIKLRIIGPPPSFSMHLSDHPWADNKYFTVLFCDYNYRVYFVSNFKGTTICNMSIASLIGQIIPTCMYNMHTQYADMHLHNIPLFIH